LSAAEAAATQAAAAKEEARVERAERAAERAAAAAAVEAARAEAAREKAAARAVAVTTANKVLGRTKSTGKAAEIAEYASTVEGWSELSIPKRVALICSRFEGVSAGELVQSSTCEITAGEDVQRVKKRIYKCISEIRAGATENAPAGVRRLNVA